MKKQASMMIALFSVLSLSQVAQAATVATVNGKVITDEDLNNSVATLPMQQRDRLLKDPTTRNQIVQSLINQELMVEDASSKKIENSKEYKDSMAVYRKQLLSNLLVKQQLAPKVTDSAVKSYFEKNKIKYGGDQVHAQHILLASEKEAQDTLSEAKKGADFQKLAETRSKDPSAKNNRGDVGFFSRETFDPAFSDAAFGAKIGEIVGPVKTPFGYHVIKVVDRKVGKTPEFAEVETRVRSDYQREVLQAYIDGLRKKAKIKL
jgi:peptidyl-prolyl cis-trans isomerase C